MKAKNQINDLEQKEAKNIQSEQDEPLLVWLSGLSASLQTKEAPVWLPVRAHAWVAGHVPCCGEGVRGNHTLMFLSLTFSLPSPLSKNKENLLKNVIL